MILRPADNPFASRRIDELAFRFVESNMDRVIERIRHTGHRGAIVGPHGSGKTTLLEQLSPKLGGSPVWIRLDRETTRPMHSALDALPRAVDADHLVLIDGAEQLGGPAWWRLEHRLRSAGAVVITSHRAGRLPTLYECTTSPRLLAELIEELAPEAPFEIDVEAIFRRHGGNIRLCFRELYDRWAGRHR